MKNFLFQLKKKGEKKRSRSNDFGSDEYPYSILYSDPRISEYSDTRSSPSDNRLSPDILLVTTGCQQTKKSGDDRLSADLAFKKSLRKMLTFNSVG